MNAPFSAEALDANETRQTPIFQEYLRVLSRHRYSIIGLALLFALIGGLRAGLETPIYRSIGTLLIDREPVRYVQVQEVYGAQTQGFEYYNTQFEILKTMPLALRTAQIVGPQRILDGIKRRPPFSLARLLGREDPEPPVLSDEQKLQVAAAYVRSSISLLPVRMSQLVRISSDLPDSELAAEIVNAHGRAYIESTLEARIDMASQATSFLSGRTSKMRLDLEEAERALQAFKQREGLVEASMGDLPSQELGLLSAQLNEAQSNRLGQELLYTQAVRALKENNGLDGIIGLSVDTGVEASKNRLADARKRQAELSTRYGPQHPEIQAVKAEIEITERDLNGRLRLAAEQVVQRYEAARLVENQIRGRYEAARGRLQTISAKSGELSRLERDLEAKRLVYDKFQTQFNETTGVKGLDTVNARMIEEAVPTGYPVYPNIRRSVLAACFLGLLIGVALAFLLDHLDSTIKTSEDVERRLQAPVLGLVPTLKTTGKKDVGPLRYYSEHPGTGFAEAIRTARTNILLSGINRRHRKLLITSSVPGEGKTTTVLNMAQAFSQMNKVLVIDADMRRPSVGLVFTGKSAPPVGLSQFISGEAKVSECVTQLENNGPYIMTAGVIPPNPLELLSSPRFAEALESLGKVFDYIIIDCAPTLAVSDALVLSKLVDGVIYVVKSDSTPYMAAQSGVRRLRRIEAPLLGVVLNRIGERPHGYGYGRYSSYADGYYAYNSYYQADNKRTRKS